MYLKFNEISFSLNFPIICISSLKSGNSETRQWWFKIQIYHATVNNIIYINYGALHVMCRDLISESMINFQIQE